MIRELVKYNQSIFKGPMQSLTPQAPNLVTMCQDLYDTHFQNSEHVGVGLAASQIGYPFSLFLVYIHPERAKFQKCEHIPPTFWINAVYCPLSDVKVEGTEACYSVPERISRKVPRHSEILVKGDKVETEIKDGTVTILGVSEQIFIKLSGFPARVFQHEIDHCSTKQPLFYYDYLTNGIAATDKFDSYTALFK